MNHRTGIAILAAALIAVDRLEAQDLALFATAGRDLGRRPLIYGAGVSLSGFTRLGSVMGADAGRLQRSDVPIGMRLTYTHLRYVERPYYCPAEVCSPQPSTPVETRLHTYHVALLVLPYRTQSTRVELGGGIGVSSEAFAFSGVLGASHRLRRRVPLWVSVGWEPQKWIRQTMADGGQIALPGHSFRLGLSWNLRGR